MFPQHPMSTEDTEAAQASPAVEGEVVDEPRPVRETEAAPAREPIDVRPEVPHHADEDQGRTDDRWQELQAQFVDDPRAAAEAAARLAEEAIRSFTAEIGTRRSQLEQSAAGEAPDTERLRLAVQGFRELVDRVLEPSP
jgi:hypothetical protein